MKLAVFFTLFLSFQLAFAEGLTCAEFFSRAKDKIFGVSPKAGKYRDPYYAGVSEANELVQITRLVRKEISGLDYNSAIHMSLPVLHPIVRDLIKYLGDAQLSQPIWKRISSNHRLFSDLKKEAQDRIVKDEVSYEWLINFSMRVSILSDVRSEDQLPLPRTLEGGKWKNPAAVSEHIAKSDNIRSLLNSFAKGELISLPFTSDLGISAVNLLTANRIAPLGHIINKVAADGVPDYYSYSFWDHDTGHAFLLTRGDKKFFNYAEKYFRLFSTLDSEQRLKAEFMFFAVYHETIFLSRDSVLPEPIMRQFFNKFIEGKNGALNLVEVSQDPIFMGDLLSHAGVNIAGRFQVEAWLRQAYEVFASLHTEAIK